MTLRNTRQHRQRGAVAIEFVLLFPLFLVIFYAIISYSVILAAQQGLHSLSSEAARATIAVFREDPSLSTSDIESLFKEVIQEEVDAAWLGGWVSACEGQSTFFDYRPASGSERDELEVCVRIGVGTDEALALPRMTFPWISIPAAGLDELTSTSNIRL